MSSKKLERTESSSDYLDLASTESESLEKEMEKAYTDYDSKVDGMNKESTMKKVRWFLDELFGMCLKDKINPAFKPSNMENSPLQTYLDIESVNKVYSFIKRYDTLSKVLSMQKDVNEVKHKSITVIGNIGSGKTTTLKNIAKALIIKGRSFLFLGELVDNEEFKLKLERYYQGKENAYQFQRYIIKFFYIRTVLARIFGHLYDYVLNDRNVSEERVFRRVCVENGTMSLEEFGKLEILNNELLTKNVLFDCVHADISIFKRISVPVIMSRIEKRGRKGENLIEKSYLELLANEYDILYNTMRMSHYMTEMAFLIIDEETDKNPETHVNMFKRWFK